MRRTLRALTLVVALVLVAAACGARVDQQQLEAAGGGGGLGAGTGSGGATSDGTSSGDGAVSGGGGTEAAGGGGAAAGGGGAGAPAAPEGGNGGAVDIGITANEVLLGNVSTLSGPVPGLFQGAVIGAQAVVAYQNSLGGLFGRKFKLEVRDDAFDTGQNRSHTTELVGKAFAFVGSFSLYDDAALDAIVKSGMPDVTYSLSPARKGAPNNFSVEPGPPGWRLGPLNYYKQKYGDAVTKVGTIFSDIPSSRASHEDMKAAARSVGWNFIYERGVSPTETDFTADVVRMRQEGVEMVYAVALDGKTAARLAKAMAQQGWKPKAFAIGGAGYDPNLIALAGSGAEGMINDQLYSLFSGEDSSVIPEVKLFNEWVQKVKPGYKPDLFAAFAWGSGRLLFEAMEKAGPKAKRADVNAAIKAIGEFDSNGLLSPGNPGTKGAPTCYILATVKGGKWQRLDSPPPGYRCGDGGFFAR